MRSTAGGRKESPDDLLFRSPRCNTAGATILLLFNGMLNSWDTATYVATQSEGTPIGSPTRPLAQKNRKRRR
jgi:hypothetical protein